MNFQNPFGGCKDTGHKFKGPILSCTRIQDDEKNVVNTDFLETWHKFKTQLCQRTRWPSSQESFGVHTASVGYLLAKIFSDKPCKC